MKSFQKEEKGTAEGERRANNGRSSEWRGSDEHMHTSPLQGEGGSLRERPPGFWLKVCFVFVTMISLVSEFIR